MESKHRNGDGGRASAEDTASVPTRLAARRQAAAYLRAAMLTADEDERESLRRKAAELLSRRAGHPAALRKRLPRSASGTCQTACTC